MLPIARAHSRISPDTYTWRASRQVVELIVVHKISDVQKLPSQSDVIVLKASSNAPRPRSTRGLSVCNCL